MRGSWSAAWVVVGAAAAWAWAGPARGPALGNVRYTASIDGPGDVDEFAGTLVAGEVLRVRVAPVRGSALAPRVEVVSPGGAVHEASGPASSSRRSAEVAIGESGVWAVRVAAGEGAGGGYQLRISVAAARRSRARRVGVGGAAPVSRHEFDAADGASLSLAIVARGPGAPVVPDVVVTPSGERTPIPSSAYVVRGGRTELRDFAIASGPGRYAVELVASAGGARCSVSLRVAPPPRPQGRVALADEPFLLPRAEPVEGVSGAIVRLPGARFAATPPRSRVWFGAAEAAVAAATGAALDVVAPAGAEGDVVDVTVQNPDGQAVTRAAYFRYGTDVPLGLASLDPAEAVLQPGASRRFTVALTRRAPPLGADVALAATGGVGSAPASVHVPPGSASASFDLVAATATTSGRVDASFAGSTLSASVTIVPPAALAAISPGPVTLGEGVTQRFTVLLESPAPPAGIDVALSATGGIGTIPGFVRIEGLSLGAGFDLVTSKTRATGVLRAAAANSVETEVTVAPPSSLDLSGWRIEQTSSVRTFTLPPGTVLGEGGYLVVGRNATLAEFQAFWGRTLGPGVVYVNSLDQGPSVNGSETFQLRDAAGASVDGPSVAMPSAAASVLRRIPGTPAGAASSWTTLPASTVSNATPGGGQAEPETPSGVYVSEFADATGSGNYVYEFVEVHFDRLP